MNVIRIVSIRFARDRPSRYG